MKIGLSREKPAASAAGTEPRASAHWIILIVIYLCMLSYTLVLQSIPPVLSLIIDELRLSYHQAGVLMSLFALPGIIVSLPAGMLADRFGVKPIGIASFVVTITGTVMVATADTFTSLALGRVAAGAGSISLIVIAPQGIAQWFKGREMGVAMGVYNTALPVGVITSLNAFPAAASHWGWRSGTWAAAAFTATALVIFSLYFRETRAGTPGTGFSIPGRGRENLLVGLVALSWALFSACIVSIYTFAPDFMVGRGLSLKSAGFNTSLVVAAPLVLSPLIGYAVDKIGYPEAFIALGGLGMAALLPLVPASGSSHLAVLMVAVGIGAALIPAPTYSLTAEVVSHKRLGFGFGVLSMLNNAGVFVGPQLVGLSRDMSGSYSAGFGLMALFVLLSAIAAAVLWAKRRRTQDVEPASV